MKKIVIGILTILLITSCTNQSNFIELTKEISTISVLTPTGIMVPTSKLPTATLYPSFQITRNVKATNTALGAYISEEKVSGKDQGALIVKAIEMYYQDNGYYPDNLEDLDPDYLAEIPITITGQEFEYRNIESFGYLLSFRVKRASGYYICGYVLDLEIWECSTIGS